MKLVISSSGLLLQFNPSMPLLPTEAILHMPELDKMYPFQMIFIFSRPFLHPEGSCTSRKIIIIINDLNSSCGSESPHT